jgi:DNA-binding SARP family transcriptional activator
MVGVLGPVVLWRSGQQVSAGPPGQQAVFAMLALRANHVLAQAELIDGAWGEHPPASAPGTVHAYVARLRRLLEPDRPIRAPSRYLVSTSAGYVLRLSDNQLDAATFERHCAEAREQAARGDHSAVLRSLRPALALWRGPVLGGVPGPFAETQRQRLDEYRVAAMEQYAQALVSVGDNAPAIATLSTLVNEHPYRESLRALLMQALYVAGRQSEALEVYRDGRRVLSDELGIEPGPSLRRVHEQILANDRALSSTPSGTADPPWVAAEPVPPAELPADVVGFTGRAAAIRRILDLVGDPDRSGVVVCAIDGTAGVGKSTLAIHVGHLLTPRFTDGMLYVDLQGSTMGLAPLEPLEVLRRWLRAFGTETPADQGLPEVAARFRSTLAHRRVLIVLDNAASASQVRPLLPAGAGCVVLITSRPVLAWIDNAVYLHLDVLSHAEAMTLLGRLVDTERVLAQPGSAQEVVSLCGHLPLALRIVAARLTARPDWQMRDLEVRLREERHRLDELSLAETGIRASFASSYQDLSSTPAGHLFRLLGLVDAPDITVPAAMALTSWPKTDVEAALDVLVQAALVGSTGGRYHMHDLIRLYARERGHEEEQDGVRPQAVSRLVDWYCAGALRATWLVHPTEFRYVAAGDEYPDAPELADRNGALSWVGSELVGLLAAARQAAAGDALRRDRVIHLALALYRPLLILGSWYDLRTVLQLAVRIAADVGDRASMAQVYEDLAYTQAMTGMLREALHNARQAMATWREVGRRIGEHNCLSIIGQVYRIQHRYARAIPSLTAALAVASDIGHRAGEAQVLNHLGLTYQGLGRLAEAVELHNRSLRLYREMGGQSHRIASTMGNLAWAALRGGDPDQAISSFQQALSTFRRIGDRYNQAEMLWGLASAHQRLGHDARAVSCRHASIELLERIGELDPDAAQKLLQQPDAEPPEAIRRNT